MADASGQGEASDEVCEIVDVPAGFISDVWQRFGFHLLRNEKSEKVTDNNNMQTLTVYN